MSDPLVSPPPDAAAATAPSVGASGFGKLARGIARRTTDLLAIGVVAAGLLAVAGKLTRWWSAEPDDLLPAVPAVTSTEWGAGGGPVSLEFGDLPYTLRRQTVRGDAEEAGERLLAACRDITAAATEPAGDVRGPEIGLLDALKSAEPAEELPGGGRLVRVDEPLPMVLGTRVYPADGSGRAAGRERVVCWGRAFPFGESDWMLFLFHSPGGAGDYGPLPESPLPPGARVRHSIREGSGVAWVGIDGEGTPRQWQRFLDGWFAARGWRRDRDWQARGAGWTAGYRAAEGAGSAEIHFAETDEGVLSGMLGLAP